MPNTPVSARLLSRRPSSRRVRSTSQPAMAGRAQQQRRRGGSQGGRRPRGRARKLYAVEELRGMRTVRGVRQFLVKWDGYEECSWEPDSHLPAALIADFEAETSEGRRQGSQRDGDGDGDGDADEDADEADEAHADEEHKDAEGLMGRSNGEAAGEGELEERAQRQQRVNRRLPVEAQQSQQPPQPDGGEETDADEQPSAAVGRRRVTAASRGKRPRSSSASNGSTRAQAGSRATKKQRTGGKRTGQGRRTKRQASSRRADKRLKQRQQQESEEEAQEAAQDDEDEDGADQWEVEAVVDSRPGRRGETEYRLRWKKVDEEQGDRNDEGEREGAGDGEQDAHEEVEKQSYSWVTASDCHCDELIRRFEQRRQQRQQAAGAVGAGVGTGAGTGVLIELVEELESHQTTLVIEDVTALVAVDAAATHATASAADDDEPHTSVGGLVEEGEVVIMTVREHDELGEEQDEHPKQDHRQVDVSADADEHGDAAEDSETDVEQQQRLGDHGVGHASTQSSTGIFPKPPLRSASSSSSLRSSASSFMRRSVSPFVERVNAVLSVL